MNLKQIDIGNLQSQIDELTTELNNIKESNRKQLDTRDIELNTLRLNNDTLQIELTNCQKELKQAKTRFEGLRTKEKENQMNYGKTLEQLEAENEILNSKCLDLSKELAESKARYDSIKCQLSKYEQLIDNLNEQVILLKRELKEHQMDFAQINQNYDLEVELKGKLESKCHDLEKQLVDLKEISNRHEKCEKVITDIKSKLSQTELTLNKKLGIKKIFVKR